MTLRHKNIPIISFYSYKGGSGRSVATVNSIGFIAENLKSTPEQPLLVMDMDVDSAGITDIVSSTKHFENINASKLLKKEVPLTSNHTRKQFMETLVDITEKVMGNRAEKRTILFLGNDTKGAAKALSPDVIAFLKRQLVKSFSGIVMDSASGRQAAAHICYRMSNVIVCCCRLSRQHIFGTKFLLNYYRGELDKKRVSSKFIILPVAVPEMPIKEDLKKIEGQAWGDLSALAQSTGAYLVEDGVPEVESLKWKEFILRTKKDLTEDEDKAVAMYKFMADKVVDFAKDAQ